MTLFKQIALLVTLLMVVLLGTVLVLNFSNTTTAAQEQLYEDAQNTATSLSLSLGTAGGDESTMSTMINANFDSGHYRRIALHDMQGELLFERISDKRNSDVPSWFTKMVTIDTPTAQAQVSAGWNPVGVLSVQSDNGNTYDMLYTSFIGLLSLFGGLFVIGLGLLYLMLHIVLQPLEKVRRQAEAILGNQFIIQQELPYTTEFKDVVNGMNTMIGKVKDVFEKGNKAMQHNRELLYQDNVCKLYNRRYLVMKLPEFLGEETPFDFGVVLLMSLQGAHEANRQLGRQKTDEMFADLGRVLHEHSLDYTEAVAARLNGTEFALLLPGCDEEGGATLAESLTAAAHHILVTNELTDAVYSIHTGVYRYSREQSIGDILSNADYALSQAKLLGDQGIYHHLSHCVVGAIMGKEAWRKVLNEALEEERFTLRFWPVYDMRAKKLYHNITTFSLQDARGDDYSYGTFIAPVIELGMLSKVYLHVIELLLRGNRKVPSLCECAVRLPAELLQAPHLNAELSTLLERYRNRIPQRLIFEIPDALIGNNIELCIRFAEMLKGFGVEFGINQFNGASQDYSFLQEFKPAYIKAGVGFLMDQSPQSMSTLQILTETIGIALVAESVSQTAELDAIENRGIHIIQGPLAEQFI